MHTWTARLNALVSHASFVLFVLAITNYFTSFWLLPKGDVPVSLAVDSITLNKERFGDVAHIRFSLNTDLRHLFNWNTKMLFLSVKAYYQTADLKKHENVIWDLRVYQNTQESSLSLKNEAPEYHILDPLFSLRNNTVRLAFTYNRIPITGLLEWSKETSATAAFPDVYANEKK